MVMKSGRWNFFHLEAYLFWWKWWSEMQQQNTRARVWLSFLTTHVHCSVWTLFVRGISSCFDWLWAVLPTAHSEFLPSGKDNKFSQEFSSIDPGRPTFVILFILSWVTFCSLMALGVDCVCFHLSSTGQEAKPWLLVEGCRLSGKMEYLAGYIALSTA